MTFADVLMDKMLPHKVKMPNEINDYRSTGGGFGFFYVLYFWHKVLKAYEVCCQNCSETSFRYIHMYVVYRAAPFLSDLWLKIRRGHPWLCI